MKKRHDWTRVTVTVGVNNSKKVLRLQQWLIENFGPQWCINNRTGCWQLLWSGNSKKYDVFFANDEDATLFSLKWL